MRRILLVAALMPLAATAQLFTGHGASVTLRSGAQLTVKGDVLAIAGTTVINNGLIDMSGDLTNNSGNDLFGPSQGTVIMNGATQSIGGASIPAFDDLDLQCTSLTLQQDVLVGGTYPAPSGVLAVNDAIVQLNSQRIVVSNATTGAITRINGHLVSETGPIAGYGEVEWHIGGGTGPYIVPFGTGAAYVPVTLDITSPGTGTGAFVFSTYPTDPFAVPNNRPLPTGLTVLTDMGGGENAPNVVDRFWPISDAGYTIAPTAAITFAYRDAEWNTGTNTIAEGSLQAQHFNGTAWSYPPSGSANTATNTVTAASSNSFNLVWALAQSFTPLPVELIAFTGERINEGEVALRWSTATEHNNAGFEVWRKIEGETDFKEVIWVDGAGESQSLLEYGLVDGNSTERTSYYRLKQVDHDGIFTWSDVVAVNGTDVHHAVVLFPNPASGSFTIAGVGPDVVGVALLDAAGRRVEHWSTAGLCEITDVPTGAYTVSIERAGGERIVERLIVR